MPRSRRSQSVARAMNFRVPSATSGSARTVGLKREQGYRSASGGSIASRSWGDLKGFQAALEPNGFLEAAVLLKRTGAPIVSWTRTPVAADVVATMAATMLGSVETIVGALGGPGIDRVAVRTPKRRMVARNVNGQVLLFLVAPSFISEERLQAEADRIIERLPTLSIPERSREARAMDQFASRPRSQEPMSATK